MLRQLKASFESNTMNRGSNKTANHKFITTKMPAHRHHLPNNLNRIIDPTFGNRISTADVLHTGKISMLLN